ncbi:hypothetical protein TRFO_31314 [Tritrichomonas foetus]|uniref:Uncharacterized protein n=1 Tax=Tritrichomonas foetus TaxID=1144522 RepID=A0A1J4JW46_9EUKA|nr:hypothetical protein TRFO_31314 [Tritrichomonas foetus]|eukprot:OHT01750.1 hypothetical protein TRFO_31314 [Tritrichomonas foetus]
MMKSDIVFENFEILHRHIPPLFIQVETILKECGETGQVTKLIHSPDGQKISAFFENRIQEMSFQVNNITLSKDIIANVTNFNVKTTNILSKIDYVFQWIYQTELQLKSFESLPPLLDIEWGIRLTELSCSLFTALCKVIAFIQSRSKQISFIWFCYRSTNSKNITLSTQASYITMLLKYLFQHPYNFLSDRLGCLLSQFSTLTFQLSTTITQILTLYSTFDWSILAPGPNSIENKSLTLPQLTILKNFTLFCETLSFFAICFPAFFSEKIQLSALISNVLSECTVMLVNKRLKLSLETLFTLSKMQLPKAIITNVTKDLEIKKEITHPARLKYLIGLFGEYIDSFTATPRLLPLFMEQILSAFGYAFFELLTCISVGIESTLVIDFLAVLSQLFLIIEKEESNIQRAFLFTLRTIDQNYMNDLIKMFGRIRMSDDKEISNAVNKFSCSLDMLDLDDFDTGTRYDFNIFYITHGRIIARIINKSTNELPYFKPILDHLQNICAHSELVDSPIEMIRRICPISMLDRLISKILEYIKNSQTSLILVLPLLRLFRMFHYTEERGNLFYQCCIGYIKRIVSPISDAISMQSRNVQVARQASFDGGFKPDAFLPFNNVINSDSYSIEANLINKTGYSLQCSKSLPLSLVYGTKAIEMRDEFKKEFLNMIHRKLIDVQYQPLIVYSSLIAVSQMLRPFFSFLGIPYSKTILEFLRQATPLLDGSILNQSRLFAGTEKLYSPKSFLKFYTEELKKFIDIEHIDARYEPLGRRFV